MSCPRHSRYIAGCVRCDVNPVEQARTDARWVGEFSSRNQHWDAPEPHQAEEDRCR